MSSASLDMGARRQAGARPAAEASVAAAASPAPAVAVPRTGRVLGVARDRWPRILAPLVLGLAGLLLWELVVRAYGIAPYVLPGPWLIAKTLVRDWAMLSSSMWLTLTLSLAALSAAVVVGLLLAVLFTQSKWLELSLFPYAVVMQVTPVVAIAPLIIIWADNVTVSLLICAWLVAFFPILSNTTLGLNSADRQQLNLFRLYRATRWQTLLHLRLPSAMPYFLGGLRISGGLSLIGAVVAEFVAGTGGSASGLAFRILEAGFNLEIPRMFAALALVSACGIVIFVALSLVSHLSLRHWHDSALAAEE